MSLTLKPGIRLHQPQFPTTPPASLYWLDPDTGIGWTYQSATGTWTPIIPSLDLNFAGTKSLRDGISGRDLVTFTRASSGGTYTDSQGVLRTATTNLLLRSEEFDNAAWVKTRTSVTANAIVAPDGSLTADRINEDTTATSTHLVAQTGALITSVGTRYTYSVYAKADGRNWLVVSPGGTWGYAWFNVSNGTLGTIVDGGGATTASITETGNGWYRCIVSATAVEARGLQLLLSTSDSIITYTGNGSSGIYLWGAQLEQSSTVGEYIPTTSTINSAPRFDHNPATGESLGLLVEEQRANLCLQSENLGTTWTTAAVSVTANQRTAPDGTLSMDTVTATGGAGFLQQAITVTNSTVYTASVYVYAASNRTRIIIHNGTSDICNITWTSISGNTTSVSGTASSIASTHVGNSIYRLGFTFTSTSTTANFRIQPLDGSGNAVSGATGDFWGAQLEAGAFPTSYIKTEASAATRAADVASITGTSFSSWYRQDEGSFLASGRSNDSTINVPFLMTADDGSLANEIFISRRIGSFLATSGISASGVFQADMFSSAWATGSEGVIAVGLGTNNSAIAFNGQTPVTDASVALPVVSTLRLGRRSNTFNVWNGTIRRLVYWGQRLPNNVLQAITL